MNQQSIDKTAAAQLFSAARTFTEWQDRAIDAATLRALYDLAKWAPTSMNSNPARLLFVTSAVGKERLRPALAPGNVDKMMNAPATVIVAGDPQFYEHLPELFPAYANARDMYAGNLPWAAETAFRNSSMQGAYLIIAARALGLDCGPMSGFDNARVDAEFFAESGYRSNFLLNIGYGAGEKLFPRGPRLSFEQAAAIV
ncbi:MAG TPA: malonic semialdehyde reductase [Spongiibacteraceae bacterium]|nr:malonic semialdehyde reductase [Spongiibacteraceae bacterium]